MAAHMANIVTDRLYDVFHCHFVPNIQHASFQDCRISFSRLLVSFYLIHKYNELTTFQTTNKPKCSYIPTLSSLTIIYINIILIHHRRSCYSGSSGRQWPPKSKKQKQRRNGTLDRDSPCNAYVCLAWRIGCSSLQLGEVSSRTSDGTKETT